jgi:hypothetical protein
MGRVVARACLAAAAVLLAAWLGVLLRDAVVVKSAGDKAFFTPGLTPAQFDHEIDRLESARLLEPGREVDELLAGLYSARGMEGRYLQVADRFTRQEPENVHAWLHLYRATRESNPGRAAFALTEIRRLNPLAATRLPPVVGAPASPAAPASERAPRR